MYLGVCTYRHYKKLFEGKESDLKLFEKKFHRFFGTGCLIVVLFYTLVAKKGISANLKDFVKGAGYFFRQRAIHGALLFSGRSETVNLSKIRQYF